MIGVYFSGTGNTKHCTEKLVHLLDETAQSFPIESEETVKALSRQDFVVLAYPVQYSNMPVIVREFIKSHAALWKNKKVLCVATMALFSGDGAGCSARLLKKYGAEVVGGLHILMPDSICDVKLLKRSGEKNRKVIRAADRKIEKCAEEIRQGKYPKNGLRFHDRIAGLVCQRLWFYGKTKNYSDRLKIGDACTGCGQCTRLCPMGNLALKGSRAAAGNRCTMCYRCISTCPVQAITLLGDKVVEQCRYDRYGNGGDSC
ncbi:MAG: EFR1 family ferrodoxin [Lachnospiraceae bacterium]|nr:EFR1 family ferrodoxin [Lachnospiraceae bacterium]